MRVANTSVIVSACLGLAAFSGCSTYAVSRYAVPAENVSTLRAYRGRTVSVGPFTATKPGETEIGCRAVGPIRTPDGESFEEFIRKALIAELTIAEVYAEAAPFTPGNSTRWTSHRASTGAMLRGTSRSRSARRMARVSQPVSTMPSRQASERNPGARTPPRRSCRPCRT
jgi:hypothetical protein